VWAIDALRRAKEDVMGFDVRNLVALGLEAFGALIFAIGFLLYR
jgi:hypothetical protein